MVTLLRTSVIARRIAAGTLIAAAFSAPVALAASHGTASHAPTTVAMKNCDDGGGFAECSW
ncbi:MAG TPA: hypothetical protein VGN35_10075 [Jatrophihabitantaceae bacterium]|jgi:hypothetical protein|nr:hypothetical protein [Jatrophihabitantaceae bacterium]